MVRGKVKLSGGGGGGAGAENDVKQGEVICKREKMLTARGFLCEGGKKLRRQKPGSLGGKRKAKPRGKKTIVAEKTERKNTMKPVLEKHSSEINSRMVRPRKSVHLLSDRIMVNRVRGRKKGERGTLARLSPFRCVETVEKGE